MRIQLFGREHPGPGCRVEGISESVNYNNFHGLILERHVSNKALVLVRWDDEPDWPDYVTISLLQDEGVLDQLARPCDGS